MVVNCYETIIIFNGKYTEAKYKTLVEKYTNELILDLKAHITNIEKIGKKKLAYEIKGIKEGWYVIFTYEANKEMIIDLERTMRTDDAVIKFLTIKRDLEKDELEEYAEVDDHPGEVESEQEIDCWNTVFNFEEVS